MSHLSGLLSPQDIETITRLLDMAERSSFGLFEATVGGLTVRIERAQGEAAVESVPVRAPAVGIYRAGKAALSAGASVDAGAVVGHIETLDQRTDVAVSTGGIIADLSVQDGQFVEYGQSLLVISPAAA